GRRGDGGGGSDWVVVMVEGVWDFDGVEESLLLEERR
ncbi:hypothetical protein A2U01_0102886, partial [Trifolium medium]|nr:hypothetical protein [Trifolium medium]